MEVSNQQQTIQLFAEKTSPEATQYIIEAMQPLVLAVATKYKSIEPLEDLIQEGNYALLEAIQTYNANQQIPFLAYAKSKVTYGIFNHVKRQKSNQDKQQMMMNDNENGWEQIADASPGLESMLIQDESHQTLMRALACLSVPQREIIRRHYFKGEKCMDIAFEKGVHYKAVLQMKKRALQRLKEQLICEMERN
jgi:RNA polymerase sporulation-specific sigma factor